MTLIYTSSGIGYEKIQKISVYMLLKKLSCATFNVCDTRLVKSCL